MALKNIPVIFEAYRLMITEAPVMKMRKDDKSGEMVPAKDYQGVQQFVVALFAKPRPNADGYQGKGEEIRVTLATDPGEGFEEGSYVDLIAPTVSYWSNDNGSGLSFKAQGLTPRGQMSVAA